MICKFQNILVRYIDKVILGHNNLTPKYYETNILSLCLWILLSLMITLCMTWWIVPLRLVLKPIIYDYKFVCGEKDE